MVMVTNEHYEETSACMTPLRGSRRSEGLGLGGLGVVIELLKTKGNTRESSKHYLWMERCYFHEHEAGEPRCDDGHEEVRDMCIRYEDSGTDISDAETMEEEEAKQWRQECEQRQQEHTQRQQRLQPTADQQEVDRFYTRLPNSGKRRNDSRRSGSSSSSSSSRKSTVLRTPVWEQQRRIKCRD
jgi:hypothetical protein